MNEQYKHAGAMPYLSPLSALAFSIGVSIGWGSLVVMSSNYLGKGGPVGTVVGLIIGAALMIVMARNFHYMVNHYPEAGGIYSYTKNVFGYDRAFIVSWFTTMTYMAMFWANATSLPLFARYFIGDLFRFGYLYTVFGYEIYLGEVILTIAAILLITLLCTKSRVAAARIMTVMVAVFTVAIVICFFVGLAGHGSTEFSFTPAFLPDSSGMNQIVGIILVTPWAFIGFESITHSAGEFKFKTNKVFRILTLSVVITTALYIFVTLLSISAYPPECGSWLDYISNLGNYSGIEGLPAFYAAKYYLGDAGIVLLMAALLSLVLTSLIGNMRSLGRLLRSTAEDNIISPKFAELNKMHVPANAMLFVALISVGIVFLGRTSIGWIVDITTIGATIIYGFVSAAAYKVAKEEKKKTERITGAIGFLAMIVFAFYLLFPLFFGGGALEPETYLLLIIWTVAGFFYFRHVVSKDHARHFGKAIVVWISLLAFIILLSIAWSGTMTSRAESETVQTIQSYYDGSADPEILALDEKTFIENELEDLNNANLISNLVMIGIFALAMVGMISNHLSMEKWENKAKEERDQARTVAYIDSLTGVKSKHAWVEAEENMDIRMREKEISSFGVLVCDVNGLKFINDTLGHKAGDDYIRAASELLCRYFQHSPVFRIGGDEFVVMLEGKDYDHREDILAEANREIEGNVGTGNVVISIGRSDFRPKEDISFNQVFARADERMYVRKKELKSMGAATRD